jgi:hypothetical protein
LNIKVYHLPSYTDDVLKIAERLRQHVFIDEKHLPVEESVAITAAVIVLAEISVGDGKKADEKRAALLEMVGTLFDHRTEFIKKLFK